MSMTAASSGRQQLCGGHHTASRARTIAGLSEFLTLIQSLHGPER
jgi:hypothetical protein